MADVYGSGGFLYKYVDGWDKLPEGWSFRDCPSVGVDSQDNVYVITRGEHPIIVFDREGNFLRSFGDGLFSQWTHGLLRGLRRHHLVLRYPLTHHPEV